MTVRPATTDDAAAVLSLAVACDVADIGYADTDVGDIEADLQEPGAETWVAVRTTSPVEGTDAEAASDRGSRMRTGDPPVGYATLDADGRAFVSVPPAARGRGIGTTLREHVETRARERGIERVRQFTFGSNDAARELLAGAGYSHSEVNWRMRGELASLAELPPLPPGIRVGDFAATDQEERALWQLITTAMAAVPGNRPVAFDVFTTRFTRRSGFDPALTLVAREGDQAIIGTAMGNRFGDGTGFVDWLAVAPERQGKGLGRALLARLLQRFRERGDTLGELNVAAANEAGLRLYESVGMMRAWRTHAYVKDLVG